MAIGCSWYQFLNSALRMRSVYCGTATWHPTGSHFFGVLAPIFHLPFIYRFKSFTQCPHFSVKNIFPSVNTVWNKQFLPTFVNTFSPALLFDNVVGGDIFLRNIYFRNTRYWNLGDCALNSHRYENFKYKTLNELRY
jgi:hypothetical protein